MSTTIMDAKPAHRYKPGRPNASMRGLAATVAGQAAGRAADPSPEIEGTVSGYYEQLDAPRNTLRLDVDGDKPQMVASGVIASGISDRVHWIARLQPEAADRWAGEIFFKDGTPALLPHTQIHVSVSQHAGFRHAQVDFRGASSPNVRGYRRRSPSFFPMEFEFDVVDGTTAVTEIDTHAHPNRPADLPREALSIATVFRRAGFDVSTSSGSGSVALRGAGANQTWSDAELHDAMQTYWSHFANKAQWSLWVLLAAQHDQGPSLGGIMFDDIGPNHRQGTAIFNNSFIANAPSGDAAPEAWVERMKFWTACHEIGHAFNLAHSWQKELGTPWLPISNEAEARSFMNYPFYVRGGQTKFFSDFAYRFSDHELLFMRHAPDRFVQMGNADWFDHHAFEQAETSTEPKFRLELRANRAEMVFEFLEPCVLELKLTNISDEPQLVKERLLSDADHMLVVVKPERKPARQWIPFARYCASERKAVLDPSASRYESLFVGAGRNGWDLAEPGRYAVRVAIRIDGVDYLSNELKLRIRPPRSYEEEHIAQDIFSDDVGRVLAFDGTRSLGRANDVLRETASRLPRLAVARHALVALGKPQLKEGKVLAVPARVGQMSSAADAGGTIALSKARPSEASRDLEAALLDAPKDAAETLGHVDYKVYVDDFSSGLVETGDNKAAVRAQETLHATLSARGVAHRVLAEIAKRQASLSELA